MLAKRRFEVPAYQRALSFCRLPLLFPKNLASQSFLGSLINVSKAAFRSARLSAGTILLPLLCGGSARSLDFRMSLWYNENMTYKIYDENLPHDRYEVTEVLQNSNGTKIVLEGLSHIVTVNFGFVEALCICDEGRRI